jgi:hypothetical protein
MAPDQVLLALSAHVSIASTITFVRIGQRAPWIGRQSGAGSKLFTSSTACDVNRSPPRHQRLLPLADND